ncbi:TCPA [Hepatospora eriocheir]|uniref:TCPA n=1 Tax=Hepatospora eriocheir TaxID=1081669 RepID=A0A1X0QK82_9MICR|nr:TCPA [Hepatospora eriocheir]
MSKSQLNVNSLLSNSTSFLGPAALEKSLESVRKVIDSIKTSFGPLGLDKMCIDASGDIFISNDGATIISNMTIDDPICKMLVNLALEQDKEVGDGTTSVVLFAYYLIEEAYNLIKNYNIHPSVIVSGYREAFNKAVEFIKNKMIVKIDGQPDIISAIVKTSISSKIIGEETEMVTSFIQNIITRNHLNDSLKVSKYLGGSIKDSSLYKGMILNCPKASPLMPSRIENCKILLCDLSIDKEKMPLSVNINARPEDIEAIRQKEIDLTKEKCQTIIDSGTNLLLCSGSIDELCVKMFIDHKVVAVKRVSKEDLEVIAKVTNSKIHTKILDKNQPTKINLYEEIEFGEYKLGYLDIDMSTILIKGPNKQICDEVDRSLNDAIQVAKAVLNNKSILPGGGCVESVLNIYLNKYASELVSKDYVAIHGYADSLKKVVKQLCANADVDSGVILSELFTRNSIGIEESMFYGLDLNSVTVQDNISHRVIEPAIYKLKALKAATEAAISIVRINEVIDFSEKK